MKIIQENLNLKGAMIIRPWYFTDDEKTSSPSGSGTNSVDATSGSNALGDNTTNIESTSTTLGWGIGHSYAGSYEVTINHNLNIPVNRQRIGIEIWDIGGNTIHEYLYLAYNDGTNFNGVFISDKSYNYIKVKFNRYRAGTGDWSVYRWRIILDELIQL